MTRHRLGSKLEYSVFFMPRRSMVCEKVFQEEGIFADVTLAEYPLDFIPFDSDILSLELDTAYKASVHGPAIGLTCFLICSPPSPVPVGMHTSFNVSVALLRFGTIEPYQMQRLAQ